MLSNLKLNISFMANLYLCTAEIEAVKDKHVYLFFLTILSNDIAINLVARINASVHCHEHLY